MTRKLYIKRLVIVFVCGIVLGLLVSVIGLTFYNSTRDFNISERGVTLISEGDGIIRVPRGALIEGNAVEVVDLDGRVFLERLETPFTAAKSILIKTNSTCVISLPNKYNIDYYHNKLVEKILK